MKFTSVLTVFPFTPCFVMTVPVFVDKAPKLEGSCKSWIYINYLPDNHRIRTTSFYQLSYLCKVQ